MCPEQAISCIVHTHRIIIQADISICMFDWEQTIKETLGENNGSDMDTTIKVITINLVEKNFRDLSAQTF